jgi:hypothetical protein
MISSTTPLHFFAEYIAGGNVEPKLFLSATVPQIRLWPGYGSGLGKFFKDTLKLPFLT